MAFTILIGATQAGGSSVTLSSLGGNTGSEAAFGLPSNSRLTPRIIKVFTNTPVKDPKTGGMTRARGGLRVIYGNRFVEGGSGSTVIDGNIIADVSVSWPIDQPVTVVDDVISALRGLVYSDQFVNAIKVGSLPTA